MRLTKSQLPYNVVRVYLYTPVYGRHQQPLPLLLFTELFELSYFTIYMTKDIDHRAADRHTPICPDDPPRNIHLTTASRKLHLRTSSATSYKIHPIAYGCMAGASRAPEQQITIHGVHVNMDPCTNRWPLVCLRSVRGEKPYCGPSCAHFAAAHPLVQSRGCASCSVEHVAREWSLSLSLSLSLRRC